MSCLIPRPLTGVGYYTLHLMRALLANSRDFDVRLFASMARPDLHALSELAGASSLRTVCWPMRLKCLMWTRLEWPAMEWFTGPIDIAHGAFHLMPAARNARRMLTVFDLSGLRCPESRTAADLQLHLRVIQHALPRADAIIAISQSCKSDLVELLGAAEDKVHVVYGGINLHEFEGESDPARLEAVKRRYGIDGDYLIHLGTLEPRKNLPRLLQAYARVRSHRKDMPRLVLAGRAGWMYDDVFETIAQLRLEKDVIHLGYIERQDAVTLLGGARACVYPSLYEGFGLPVLEAMAAGTPVLTSNVSSMPEVIGEHGILVDPESAASIEAGLTALLGDPTAAAQRAIAARIRAGQFTWSHSAEALAKVYRLVHGRCAA